MTSNKEINITELANEIKKIELPKEEKQLYDIIFQLKLKKKEKKLTQKHLAGMCNIPYLTIACIETYVYTPILLILLKITNALELSLTLGDL